MNISLCHNGTAGTQLAVGAFRTELSEHVMAMQVWVW